MKLKEAFTPDVISKLSSQIATMKTRLDDHEKKIASQQKNLENIDRAVEKIAKPKHWKVATPDDMATLWFVVIIAILLLIIFSVFVIPIKLK